MDSRGCVLSVTEFFAPQKSKPPGAGGLLVQSRKENYRLITIRDVLDRLRVFCCQNGMLSGKE